ncbi:MAG: NADH-quinone oxidoreductase subunit B family protein [Methanomicrobiaceae archaeon]|nr:NADH-quinone oxidoreductase subunit B family protein [Methanomicrobiaceae archaeon]
MNAFFRKLIQKPLSEKVEAKDPDFEFYGNQLKKEINSVFKRSLAIREVDCGSDNAAEIEINNLSSPYYDVERFGVTFVASPRHADVLFVTGAVTHNMKYALKKVYDAAPSPKFVVAVGDEACNGGIFKDSYAIYGPVSSVIPVDMEILGNPPEPVEMIKGLLVLMEKAGR